MKLIVCTWCEGGILMNPAECPQCEGECTYHVIDAAAPGCVIVPCACEHCVPKSLETEVKP